MLLPSFQISALPIHNALLIGEAMLALLLCTPLFMTSISVLAFKRLSKRIGQLHRRASSYPLAKYINLKQRIPIGVAGIPGSGKCIISHPLVDRINAISQRKGFGEIAICIGMDVW